MDIQKYSWPGNLRELRAVVRRAILLAKNEWITTSELSITVDGKPMDAHVLTNERKEREKIAEVLAMTGNNKKKAAEMLGIARSTLYEKMRIYHID